MNSILNVNNVDYLKQPLFLGEGLGLQRYDRFKHPVFFDLFKKQVENFWKPELINMNMDKVQFPTLGEHERFIFTKNLLFQTMLDSVVARGVPTFMKHVSNPELELCLSTWAFFENIHSYSYTYIIKSVYPNASKVLDTALEDKEILSRAASVTKAYDELNSADKFNLKERLYLSLISVNILEAVRFYVSFVCAFAFAENQKMMGNASIIKYIRKDEALHLANTQAIIKILQEEPEEGFTEVTKALADKAITMFVEAAEEEKKWASYLFQYGSMLGLNEVILHRYIEWLTDSRLKKIGLPMQFKGTTNPIKGWIEPWMDEVKVQVAPQEKEITSYKIGASRNDVGEADLTGILL